MQHIVRTRPPQGTHLDFAIINILLSVIMFIGFGLVAASYHIVGFCMAGAAAMGIVFCLLRAWAFDRHVWLSANPIILEDTPPEPEPLQQLNATLSGRHVKWGIWLTSNEWQRIARATLKNDNKISRALVMGQKVKGFHRSEQGDMIGWFDRGEKESTGWGDFVYWLVGQEILHAAAPNQANKLTAVGIAEFEALANPQTSPTPQESE